MIMQGCVISCGTVVFFQKSRNLSRPLLTNNNFYCGMVATNIAHFRKRNLVISAALLPQEDDNQSANSNSAASANNGPSKVMRSKSAGSRDRSMPPSIVDKSNIHSGPYLASSDSLPRPRPPIIHQETNKQTNKQIWSPAGGALTTAVKTGSRLKSNSLSFEDTTFDSSFCLTTPDSSSFSVSSNVGSSEDLVKSSINTRSPGILRRTRIKVVNVFKQ